MPGCGWPVVVVVVVDRAFFEGAGGKAGDGLKMFAAEEVLEREGWERMESDRWVGGATISSDRIELAVLEGAGGGAGMEEGTMGTCLEGRSLRFAVE